MNVPVGTKYDTSRPTWVNAVVIQANNTTTNNEGVCVCVLSSDAAVETHP